jgi:hypothetical protein
MKITVPKTKNQDSTKINVSIIHEFIYCSSIFVKYIAMIFKSYIEL